MKNDTTVNIVSSKQKLWGIYLFLAALFEMWGSNFWWFQSAYIEMLSPAYPGYAATWLGSFIGLLEGFICGAICGGIIAWLYNTTLKIFK